MNSISRLSPMIEFTTANMTSMTGNVCHKTKLDAQIMKLSHNVLLEVQETTRNRNKLA